MPKRRKDADGNEILTVREQLFVEHVAQGKSLTQSALAAGYSPKYAAEIGKQNYQKLPVYTAVQRRVQTTIGADTDEVLALLACHLRADVADFEDLVQEDGRLDLKTARERGVSRLIKKLDYEPVALQASEDGAPVTRYRCKVELHDSQAAARTLADIFGIKQMPRENDRDRELRVELAEKAIAALKGYIELQMTHPEALERLRRIDPELAKALPDEWAQAVDGELVTDDAEVTA
jgi:hypothetical protein